MSTILTDDELPPLPELGPEWTDYWRKTIEQKMEAYADARESAVLAKLARQEPVASVRTWHKNGDQHAELDDWGLGLASIPDGTHNLYTHPAPQQADRQRVPGPTNNYHQLREALIFADQAMAESGLLACHAVRIQIRAALDNAAAPEALAIAYLEEIYEYLCSSAPIGVADEAFRLVPAEILSFETRDRISLQRKPKGALPREISRHDGPLTRGRAGDGGSVAAPEAPAQADRQRVPDGWQLVPVEPTPKMRAVQTWDMNSFYSASKIWADMLAAAPEALAQAHPKSDYHLDEALEASRLLGQVQCRREFGTYTDQDARFEQAMHESIAKHCAFLRQP